MATIADRGRPNPYRGYRDLLPIRRVRELTQLHPGRAIGDILICWGMILGAWAAVAMWTQWWVVALAVPVVGSRYYALFIIAHDGMHRRLLRSRRANDFVNDVLILGAIGAITRLNNRNHLEHHRTLATEADPDRHRHACVNKADRPAFTLFLTGFANLLPIVRAVFMRGQLDQHEFEPNGAVADSRPRYTVRDWAILIGWQLLLVGGLTLVIGWWAYPALWLLPVYLHMYLGDLFRSFCEHSHPEGDDLADEHRLITYSPNRIERAFVAPMNMNFHAVHHLWPSIPYYNLAVADREVKDLAGAGGLERRTSYVRYAIRYWRALPLEECYRPGRDSSLRSAS